MFDTAAGLEDPEAAGQSFQVLIMHVLTGVLPREALDGHAPGTIAAFFIDATHPQPHARRAR